MAFDAANFVINPRLFWEGWTEVTRINTQAFNEASGGAIVLRSENIQGDYSAGSGLKALVGSGADENGGIQRRNTAGAWNDPFTFADPEMAEHVKPKLSRSGGAQKTLDAWYRAAATDGVDDVDLLSYHLGEMYAKDAQVDYLQAGFRAAIAAFTNTIVTNSNYLDLATGGGKATTANLARGLRLFGDASQDIICWVMDYLPYNDITVDAIETNPIDTIAGTVVYGAQAPTMGRRVVVTDCDALTNKDGGGAGIDHYYILGLTQMGIEIIESRTRSQISEVVSGYIQLVGRLQFEYDFNLGIRGSSWDKTKVNPDAATLSVGTNWTQIATSHKDLGGILIEVDSQ